MLSRELGFLTGSVPLRTRARPPIYDEVATKYKLTRADFPDPKLYSAFFDKPQVHMSGRPPQAAHFWLCKSLRLRWQLISF